MTQTVRSRRRLLAPDYVLPSQFVGTLRRQAPRKTGESRLLIAVLENAVECFQQYVRATGSAERQLFEEAEWWIMGGNEEEDTRLDADGPCFSFRYVCEALGIDPDYLRRGLKRNDAACFYRTAAHSQVDVSARQPELSEVPEKSGQVRFRRCPQIRTAQTFLVAE